MIDTNGWIQTLTVSPARAGQLVGAAAHDGALDVPMPAPERVAEGKALLMRLAAQRRSARLASSLGHKQACAKGMATPDIRLLAMEGACIG